MATGTAAASASGVGADSLESGAMLLRRRHAGGLAGAGDDDGVGNAEEVAASVEQAFADEPVPSWREQLTVRAFVVGFILAVLFSVIVMKLNLTTGVIPSLNVSASLLGYFLVRLWTKAIESVGLLKHPFTRQENTVIQTCVVSAYGLAFSGKTPEPRVLSSLLIRLFLCVLFLVDLVSVHHHCPVLRLNLQIRSMQNSIHNSLL
jgi:hypothetical protein